METTRRQKQTQHEGDHTVGDGPAGTRSVGICKAVEEGHKPFNKKNDADGKGECRHLLGRFHRIPEVADHRAASDQKEGGNHQTPEADPATHAPGTRQVADPADHAAHKKHHSNRTCGPERGDHREDQGEDAKNNQKNAFGDGEGLERAQGVRALIDSHRWFVMNNIRKVLRSPKSGHRL